MKADDALLLPTQEPKITGEPNRCARSPPRSIPASRRTCCGDGEPPDEPPGAGLGLLRSAPDEIHDVIMRIVRDPGAGQSSPNVFFFSAPSKCRLSGGLNSPRTNRLFNLIATTPRLGTFFQEAGQTRHLASTYPDDLKHFAAVAAKYQHWLGSPEENAALGLLPK